MFESCTVIRNVELSTDFRPMQHDHQLPRCSISSLYATTPPRDAFPTSRNRDRCSDGPLGPPSDDACVSIRPAACDTARLEEFTITRVCRYCKFPQQGARPPAKSLRAVADVTCPD